MLKNKVMIAPLGLAGITILSGVFLMPSNSFATDTTDAVDSVSIGVPISCSMEGTGMNSHTASVPNGTYQADIGTTTLKAYCNDDEGFAIFAVGYTGDEIGGANSTKLVGTNGSIVTGTATSGDTSNWAMKLATVTNPTPTYPITLDNGFSSYSAVPASYTKVAHRDSGTDIGTGATGSSLTTTYAAYMSQTQPAGTYSGQVIYTLVHPSDHAKPVVHPAILDTGQTVNSKLKSLAATVVNGTDTTRAYTASDNYIKSIEVHLETPAPAGFTPNEKNTISTSTSKKPVYIAFDNTNDAGIIHFYTEGDQIALSSDSSYMFYTLAQFTEISGISDWDTSSVTNMANMFNTTGYSATTFTLDLSSWDTSSVTNMYRMFFSTGYSATTWSIGDLSSWDTSSVTSMGIMFTNAGYSATTFTLDLSSWNTSKVTDMSGMFNSAGYSATTFTLDLSSWDTSSVTSMYHMFYNAGHSATTWSIGDLSSWNTSKVTDMSGMFNSAGYSATTFNLNLSSWDTSSVTSMNSMFSNAGRSATTFNLNLSSWDTSQVTDMLSMFSNAGNSATTWSVTIPQTNGNSINNTISRIYGQTTSQYGTPPSGKSFTLAQP